MNGARGLPPVLRRYWVWTMALSVLAVVYSLGALKLRLPMPYRPPNYFGEWTWWDFRIYHDRFALFGKPGFWNFNDYLYTYPAMTGVMYHLFYSLPHALASYLLLCAGAAAVWAFVLGRGLVRRGVRSWVAYGFAATVLLTCFPLFFLMISGNMEGVMAIVMGLGIWAALRARWGWAAAAFGLAGAMKIYPLLLLGLLLAKKRYGAFASGLAVAAALDVAALWWMGPTVLEAQRHIDVGVAFVRDSIVLPVSGALLPFNHSLFYVVKFAVVGVARALQVAGEPRLLQRTFAAYVVGALLAGALIYFARLRAMPMLNQVVGLTVLGVLLPPMSGSYTLVQLLVPVALVCWFAVESPQAKGLEMFFAGLVFVYTAGTYFAWKVQFAEQVRTVGLLVMLVAVLQCRWGSVGETEQRPSSRHAGPSTPLRFAQDDKAVGVQP